MNDLKDSGVYWLGQVATDWGVVPAWRVMEERIEKSLPEDIHLTPSQSYGVLSQQDYMERTGNKVVLNLIGGDKMKRVRAGDFIIHLRSFQGGIEASALNGKVSNAYTVLTPAPDAHVGYYRWFLKSAPMIEGLASSTDQLRDGQSINYNRFSRLSLPLPPLETQRCIADYLDRETAEIDAAVADLDKYVELLGKRRALLITNAVTGRDRNSLKDSGVIWLGKVASNWDIAPAWHVMKERSERSHPNDIHLTPSQNLGVIPQEEYMKITGNKVVLNLVGSEKMKRVLPGDFVIHLRSFQGGIEASTTGGKISNAYTVLTPCKIADFGYFRWLMKSKPLIEGLASSTDQLRDGQTINFSRFSRLKLPIPPLQEQRSIAKLLDRETQKIDNLISDSIRLRDLLLKRRSVLITEVVTGRKQV